MSSQAVTGNDTPALRGLAWRKSSFSDSQGGDCVEVVAAHDVVAVRDSKDPSGPVLTLAAGEWSDFLSGIRAGEFDL